MLKHIIVLLDEDAVSFCYYKTPGNRSKLMPLAILKKCVTDAIKNRLTINFIFGKEELPVEYVDVIESAPHAKIVPLALKDAYPDAAIVVNSGDLPAAVETIDSNDYYTIILRVEKEHLKNLAPLVASLEGKYKRLNLHLLDIDEYGEDEFNKYRIQLDALSEMFKSEYDTGKMTECNFLSDRMVLKSMNNCNAGLDHVTIAPNGRAYICPGFYYDNEENSVGDLAAGLSIVNRQLLQIDHAPICSLCDAYQCKRCVYLNLKTTLEINTPSREQCVLSHLERNASGLLLSRLQHLELFQRFDPILKKQYLDPFLLWSKRSESQGYIKNTTDGSIIVNDGKDFVVLPPLKRINPCPQAEAAGEDRDMNEGSVMPDPS